MKKLKLNLSHVKGNEVLSREQLKQIRGGLGSSNTCVSNQDCPTGYNCCDTTDGSNIRVCSLPSGGSDCPTSVSGCSTKCRYNGADYGCVYLLLTHKCTCIMDGTLSCDE